MSRPMLILIVILLVVIGGIVALATIDTEVPTTRIEMPVADAPKAK